MSPPAEASTELVPDPTPAPNPGPVPNADLAACGHCGYAVAGLPSFTCPECGSDLREVGIVRRDAVDRRSRRSWRAALRRPAATAAGLLGGVRGRLALFVALYLPAAWLAVDYYVDRVRPTTWVDEQVVQLKPGSGAYKSVTLTLTERAFTRGYIRPPGTPAAQRRVAVELDAGTERSVFVRDVTAGTNTYPDAAGISQTNRQPIARELGLWMAAHGVRVQGPGVGDEIDVLAEGIAQSDQPHEFWELLANRSRGQFVYETAYLNHDIEGTKGYAVPTAVAAGVGAAGLGLIGLLGRRRSRARAAGVPDVGSAGTPRAGGPPADVPALAPGVRTLSVMFSDVKDYTARTAGESRLGILELVRRHRDLADPVLGRRGGTVVKSMGDGLLIAFVSATDAVLAGLELQAAVAAHNATATADRDRLQLRVAVSTGEVAVEGGDVFGEAVNLASRAQGQAGPGEVWFTEATRATVNRREVTFVEAGMFALKGLPEPVRLYRAVPALNPIPAVAAAGETGIV